MFKIEINASERSRAKLHMEAAWAFARAPAGVATETYRFAKFAVRVRREGGGIVTEEVPANA